MKNFFKKHMFITLAGLFLLGVGGYYLLDEVIFNDDQVQVTSHQNQEQLIGEDKVKEIVEETIGTSNLTYAYINLTRDDGIQVYEVKATADNKAYELEINAVSGQVISYDEAFISMEEKESPASSASGNASTKISEEEVKEIIRKATGKSNLTFTELRLEQDDDYNGRLTYDVTAYADGIEYDYDIDAESGDILKQSSEPAAD